MCEEAYLLLKTIAKKLCAQVRLQDLRQGVIKLKDKVKLLGFRMVLLLFAIALSYLSWFDSFGLQQRQYTAGTWWVHDLLLQ